jgi:hypothetical protein
MGDLSKVLIEIILYDVKYKIFDHISKCQIQRELRFSLM